MINEENKINSIFMATKGCFVLPATRREIRFTLWRKSARPAKTWKTSRSILTEGGALTGTASRHFLGPTLRLHRTVYPGRTGHWASGQRGDSSFTQRVLSPLTQTCCYKAWSKAQVSRALPAAVDVNGGTVLGRELHPRNTLSSVTSSGSLAAGRAV